MYEPSFAPGLLAQGLPQTQLLRRMHEAVSERGRGSTGVLRGQRTLIPVIHLEAPRQACHYEIPPPFSLSWGPSTAGPGLVTLAAPQSSRDRSTLS